MSVRATRLSTLLDRAAIELLAPLGADPEIRGAALDSRRVEPGDLFFALRGERTDGIRFVDAAVARGARAIVAEVPRPAGLSPSIGWAQVKQARPAAGRISRECYGRPDESLALVGVTGTNGKTTVTHLIESIGKAAGRSCGHIGTVGAAFGDRTIALEHTTPEAPELFRLLDQMRRQGAQLVAMEVSSHALSQQRVAGARFAVAAFLNLSEDHLDYHKDLEQYFEAKALLFAQLDESRWAVLPTTADGRRLAKRTRGRVLTFGTSADADVRIRDARLGLEGSSAILDTPRGSLPIRTFLPGSANLENVTAAAACAVALELPADAIAGGILNLESIPGRLERVRAGQPFALFVDFAHTPAALESLLGWARGVTKGELHVVFGCGGERDRGKRPHMGEIAARLADRGVVTSDNPRGEDPQTIIDEIRAGVDAVSGGAARFADIVDREQAIRHTLSQAAAGDVVILAGKGHETDQLIAGERRHFDDREVSLRILRELGNDGWQHAGG